MTSTLEKCALLLAFQLFLSTSVLTGQYTRPPIVNVGKFKPISTVWSDMSSCGIDAVDNIITPTEFCLPASDASQFGQFAYCDRAQCSRACPSRTRTSSTGINSGYRALMKLVSGPCVYTYYGNDRPPRMRAVTDGGVAVFTSYPQGCYTAANRIPKFASNGFTLSVWMKQNRNNTGVILEKYIENPGMASLTVMVTSHSVVLQYLGTDSQMHRVTVPVRIAPEQWQHVAVQVNGQWASVFVNGPGPDGAPTATKRLDQPMMDPPAPAEARIGSGFRGSMQYLGQLQNFRWYEKALTNREIGELATGEFRKLRVQSECLCPLGFPRVHPVKEGYCIENGVSERAAVLRRRLGANSHPTEYINDGDNTTVWISATGLYLQGGFSIEIDLENGEYEIHQILLEFYNPQPKEIHFARISSYTSKWSQRWGAYMYNCQHSIPIANDTLHTPTSRACYEFPSQRLIPTRDQKIIFSLLPSVKTRPGYNRFFKTPELMHFMRATKVQIFFRDQYFTLAKMVHSGHRYYALRDVKIMGRCFCHGHARACDMTTNPYQCECSDDSFTAGYQCERCQPLYNDKPFRMSDPQEQTRHNCRKCECNKHADACHYERDVDEFPDDFGRGGGGVCDDCKHHTTGRFCETCQEKYYRPSSRALTDVDACQPCVCSLSGVVNDTVDCDKIDGQCACKSKVRGRTCDSCVDGHFNLQRSNLDGCEACECHLPGTVDRNVTCDQKTGQCQCKPNTQQQRCDACARGFWNLRDDNPDGCEPCMCDPTGSIDEHCNAVSGQCTCKSGVTGLLCDECEVGFWGLTEEGCRACACDEAGTVPGTVCDKTTGQCVCGEHTASRDCGQRKSTLYNLMESNRQKQ